MYAADGLPKIEVVDGELVSPDEELYTDHIEGISLNDDELFRDDLERGEGETDTELQLNQTFNQLTELTPLEQTLSEFYTQLDEWID